MTTKVKIETSTHDDFITQLNALNQISDPKQKYEVLTQSIPYFAAKNQELGGSGEQIQARTQTLKKTQSEFFTLKNQLNALPSPRKETEPALQSLDPAAIRALGLFGSAMIMNTCILVKEANWSMWNPLLYAVSFGMIVAADVASAIFRNVCCGARPAKTATPALAEAKPAPVESIEKRTFTGAELAANPPLFENKNKQTAYSILVENPASIEEEEVTLEKTAVDQDLVLNAKVFSPQPLKLNVSEGLFSYPSDSHHWTANFGDPNVFFGILSGLAAQDEIQTLEHPVLSHVYTAAKKVDPKLLQLEDGSSLLVQGALRRGLLDTQTYFDDLKGTLYGKNFSRATTEHLEAALRKIEPQKSNLFVICAPNVSLRTENELYDPETIFRMIQTAYSAFRAIQEKDPDAHLHLGNWGCGAFGNDPTLSLLIQLAAARMAGIKELTVYPLKETEALSKAVSLIVHAENTLPNITGKEFVSLLTNLAKPMNFRYRKSDGN